MLRGRRAAQVLAATIVAWLVATLLVAAYLLSLYRPDPASHAAADATLAMILASPQLVVAAVGAAALLALWNGSPSAPRLGLAWGILQSLVGLVIAGRVLGELGGVLTDGKGVRWDGSASAIVFTSATQATYTYWPDWAAVALLLAAIVGIVAAEMLELAPGDEAPFRGRHVHA